MQFANYIRPDKVDTSQTVPFNLRAIDGAFFVSNELGDWLILEPEELRRYVEGEVQPGEPLWERLAAKNFIASEIDISAQVQRYRRKKGFLSFGPTLHAFVLTERCNHGCQYCHSSIVGMGRTDTDMSVEVAERAVDMAFMTTSPGMSIEFQGGEPTANWDVLVHIVEYARKKNLLAKKDLAFALVTNFSLMTDERLEYLIDNKVQICTSLDGPEDLHNKIRIYKGGNSWKLTTEWIRKVNRRYEELGLDTTLYRVEALPTLTRDSLSRAKDIVDTYVDLGCRAVFLRKLDPYGFASQSAKKLGYSMDAYVAFYEEALEYILELNKKGVEVMERHAAIMLSKMLADYEPNYLDLRSPGGAVIGQLAYHPSGKVYTSDEGRMVAAMGDDMFLVGNVLEDGYHDVVTHPTARALILASSVDALPDCVSCVYKSYCGHQPEYNYATQGSLFGRMRDSNWCRKHKHIFDVLARKLKAADPEELRIFERWTTNRRQEHFLQPTEEAGAAG